jgi:hypothetical protein
VEVLDIIFKAIDVFWHIGGKDVSLHLKGQQDVMPQEWLRTLEWRYRLN